MPVTLCCWQRCMDVPMLTDDETQVAWHILTDKSLPMCDRHSRILVKYNRLTV